MGVVQLIVGNKEHADLCSGDRRIGEDTKLTHLSRASHMLKYLVCRAIRMHDTSISKVKKPHLFFFDACAALAFPTSIFHEWTTLGFPN